MSTKYAAVDRVTDEELAEMLLPDKVSPRTVHTVALKLTGWMGLLSFLNGVILCVAIGALIVSLRALPLRNTVQCSARLSTFSPALEAVEYETVKFNGTFRYPSIYRGTPTPELDAAWNRITKNVQPLQISRETLDKIGKADRPSLVRFKEEDGGGYMASVAAIHQLHCLNMLRKYTYNEYYKDKDEAFTVRPDIFRTHLDHCVELIRQKLMCNSDVGVITNEWVDGWDLPYPDFNTVHKCRNYEKVLDWAYKHAMHIPKENVTRLAGEVDLIVPP